MNEIYRNAFSEVSTILNYLDNESYSKIPKDIIYAIEENKNDDYEFFVDESISLSEQNLLEETKAILFNLYRDYLADKEKKKSILNYQNKEILELENIKRQKYNPDDLFKEKEIIKNTADTKIINIKKQSLLSKILNKIKSIFS